MLENERVNRIKVEKKGVRYNILERLFMEKHCGREPEDKYEIFILRIIKDLGEVYDDNSDKIRALLHKDVSLRSELSTLQGRENTLNTISNLLRKALGLTAKFREEDENG